MLNIKLRNTSWQVLAAMTGVLLSSFSLSSSAVLVQQKPVKAAFVLVGPANYVGWSYSHDQGRQYLERVLGDQVDTTVVEFVQEGRSARKTIQDLAATNDIVFTTSFGYMISTEGVAKNNTQVKFENSSGNRTAENLSGYATRAYQPRYLAGLVAGKMSPSGKIGYVAAHPIPEVIRGINAFTLGVRKANPSAEVEVQWTGAWHKPEKEKIIAQKLVAAGADILAHHTDSSTIAEFAEAKGVKVVGFHSDMSAFAPTQHLVSVTHNWGPYYVKRIKALINGSWQGHSEWMGMKEKTSRLSALNHSIPAEVKDWVADQEAAIVSGEFKVFTGPIKNTRGRVRIKEGKHLSDAKLLRMNWYVEGVTGSLLSF